MTPIWQVLRRKQPQAFDRTLEKRKSKIANKKAEKRKQGPGNDDGEGRSTKKVVQSETRKFF